ncbi:hypothetical protein PIB30_082206 [Stylosanthes scabra]|uniref:Aminotransferase-like plant mobile domain-containing protein n=1 Tax=Stylosanthes scabra TaxID=79078 RepID=A0ABU6TRH3_9FABA|nr:hypothetical protein [Stylosanthes scabra]
MNFFLLDELGKYKWGSATLAWLYRTLCRATSRKVVQLARSLALLSILVIEWHQIDRVFPQFEGVQSKPPKALDLDILNTKDGRGGDRWFLGDYPTWHREWETQMASILDFPVHSHPGPDREFLDWWYELPHRFLSLEGMLGDPRRDEVEEVIATTGTQVPPHRTQVPDVPDRCRADRGRRVGTRMSQRDNGDGDGDGTERVRRAQFRPLGQMRPRGIGRVGPGVGRGDGLGVPDPVDGRFLIIFIIT